MTSRVYLGLTIDGLYHAAPTAFSFTTVDAWTVDSGKAPAIINWFQDWSNWQATLPSVAQLQSVAARGALPMISWNPEDSPTVVYNLTDITAGLYDTLIDAFGTALHTYGGPVLVRFAHEMNGDWYHWGAGVGGNTAPQYIAMYRYVHDRVKAIAPNSLWVWCPNVNFAGEADLVNYFPGDAYIDWLGLDGYNWGALPGHAWQTFAQVFNASYSAITGLSSKPLMICETASSETGGDKAAWIADALGTQIPTTYPQIAAVVWFNYDQTGLTPSEDWRIESSPAATTAFRTAVAPVTYLSRWGAYGSPTMPAFTMGTSTNVAYGSGLYGSGVYGGAGAVAAVSDLSAAPMAMPAWTMSAAERQQAASSAATTPAYRMAASAFESSTTSGSFSIPRYLMAAAASGIGAAAGLTLPSFVLSSAAAELARGSGTPTSPAFVMTSATGGTFSAFVLPAFVMAATEQQVSSASSALLMPPFSTIAQAAERDTASAAIQMPVFLMGAAAALSVAPPVAVVAAFVMLPWTMAAPAQAISYEVIATIGVTVAQRDTVTVGVAQMASVVITVAQVNTVAVSVTQEAL